MATPLVTKIVLKNTTKMSLNERFTAYRAQAQSSTNIMRQKLQRQATSANLRLAQQMANRPTVIAALRLKKRSLQQRLGGRQQSTSNVKSRLNLNAKMGNNIRGRLGNFRGRGARRQGSFKPGTSPLLKGRLGQPRPAFNQRGQGNQNFRNNRRGNFRVGNRQNQGNNAGGNRQSALMSARGGRGNTRGGRGRGMGRWGSPKAVQPTKQELDNQLDEYMAETKGALDAELGQYMQQG